MISEILLAALHSGFVTLLDYLSAHVLSCLVPAFFIAGAIAALLRSEMVLRYFGKNTPKWLSYGVASTAGTILAVCSCTILPLFAGIEKKGAGIGPATAFLFTGPAINLLAIVLTARIARALAAVSSAVIIGLIMALIFERSPAKSTVQSRNPYAQEARAAAESATSGQQKNRRVVLFLLLLVGVLLSATSKVEFMLKMMMIAAFVAAASFVLAAYFSSEERHAFFSETWFLARNIFPLLVVGTFLVGMIGYFLPLEWVRAVFGTNSFQSCFTASIIGALLYLPTLLEVPIVGTLFGYSSGGMAPGPALSLLLAGPSLSLPNMIVIVRIIGVRKGCAYIRLVIISATLAGIIYGAVSL